MSRYIDADALIKLFQKNMSNEIQDRIITRNNINLIRSMPTAYDVDVVVEQICGCDGCSGCCKYGK